MKKTQQYLEQLSHLRRLTTFGMTGVRRSSKPKEKHKLFAEIVSYLEETPHATTFYSGIRNLRPSRGEIVLARQFIGKEYSFDNQLGRVVQIRTGCGQFGSDMYFLRLPDGSLTTAENQSYQKIPDQFIADVERHFKTDMDFENEGLEKGYSISGKYLEVGFIVGGDNTTGKPDSSFTVSITK